MNQPIPFLLLCAFVSAMLQPTAHAQSDFSDLSGDPDHCKKVIIHAPHEVRYIILFDTIPNEREIRILQMAENSEWLSPICFDGPREFFVVGFDKDQQIVTPIHRMHAQIRTHSLAYTPQKTTH